MKYININNDKDRNATWFTLMTMAAFLVFGSTSCNRLLEVTDPDIVTVEGLDSEAGIINLKNGSLADFAVAISGSSAGHGATVGLIVMSGLMTDEYDYVGTFPSRAEGDTRNLQNVNGTINTIYGNLHRTRASAEATVDRAIAFGGLPEIESEMQSIAGFSYVLFAEAFCGSVPFSKVTLEEEFILGMPLSADEMYNTAIGLFDDAIASAAAASNDDLGNLARVGKARALLGLGQISNAASEASSVPDDFVYYIEHSDNSRRQENGIFTMTTIRRQFSIADNKGINGIDYRTRGTNGDPRVPWDGGTEQGQNDRDTVYFQLKYPSPSAPVRLASGIEARLIEAEAAAQTGLNADVAAIHDDLRATEGLAPIDLTGMTTDQLVDYHFTERALWLYSSGHRHGDMRRLVNSYS
ncbi:MAG: hypothetical protein L3J29_13160, partial [Cyclobacteriaceae bacterium]|nr:hypothetical protein [Cyclobacteriaceae bacterium]